MCMYVYTYGGHGTFSGVILRMANRSFEAGSLNGLEITSWANLLTRKPLGFCLFLPGA